MRRAAEMDPPDSLACVSHSQSGGLLYVYTVKPGLRNDTRFRCVMWLLSSSRRIMIHTPNLYRTSLRTAETYFDAYHISPEAQSFSRTLEKRALTFQLITPQRRDQKPKIRAQRQQSPQTASMPIAKPIESPKAPPIRKVISTPSPVRCELWTHSTTFIMHT
jgi:hypothetical protein